MTIRDPLLDAFAAHINRTDKMSAKRSWRILQEQQVKELKNVITEELKDVTPEKEKLHLTYCYKGKMYNEEL